MAQRIGEKYDGESKACLIKYEDLEVEVGYTLVHQLVQSIDTRGVTYGKALGELNNFLWKVRSQMGADAEEEMENR